MMMIRPSRYWFIRANDVYWTLPMMHLEGYAACKRWIWMWAGALVDPDPDASPLPPPRSGSRPCSDSSYCWKKKWGCNQDERCASACRTPANPHVSANRR